MSYATVANVKSLFRQFNSGANPAVTDDEIQEFLDSSNSMINAKLGTLYTLPITVGANPESFNIVRRLETYFVADIVDDILNTYSEADKKPMWGTKGQRLLDELVPPIDPKTCKQCAPTMKLPDTPYTGTVSTRSKIKLSATTGRQFSKGVDTW